MSDFPSIADLQKKTPAATDGAAMPAKPVAGAAQSTTKPVAAADTVEGKLEKKMAEVALKEKEVQVATMAQSLGLPHIDLEKFPISQAALKQIPFEQAEVLNAVCFFVSGEEIRIGAVDPNNQQVRQLVEETKTKTQANVGLYVISPKSLEKVLKLYSTLPSIKPITKDVEIKQEDLEKVQVSVNDLESLKKLLSEASTTDVVTLVLGAGLKLGASDVHVEAEEEKIIVRFRLDGILHDVAEIQKEMYKKVVSRIKLVSALKINITDKPQDGRFTIKLTEGDVDVRVSTIPTVYGESVVMRLLPQKREGVSLESLGLSEFALVILTREISRPNGMIITTGPTGSGKTTTLYAIMQNLNKPGVKILTLEDPVEYKMEGINQSQIEHGKGYTFASGLKSMLRQDPDIAMVGEIRDLETAEIAVQAALTGHLILSTIHTNTAAGSVPRFLSMGVKPFLLGPSLNCVIGQRLVRKLCEKCKAPVELDPTLKTRVDEVIASLPEEQKNKITGDSKFYGPKGCGECNSLGYSGRVGIYEIFVVDEVIEKLILAGQVAEQDIAAQAIKNGMVTMVQDGILKALTGLTSADEVFRVIE